MSLELLQLKVFVRSATCGNISAAAKFLGITQPTASRLIKQLEQRFSEKLFQNNGHGVELSAFGHRIIDDAAALIQQADDFDNKYLPTRTTRDIRKLVVGGSRGPSASLLPSAIAAFEQSNQDLDLSLQTGTSAEIEHAVIRGNIDIAVVSSPSPSTAIAHEPYSHEELLLVVAPGHALASGGSVKPSDIAQLPLIVAIGRNGESRSEEILARHLPVGTRPNVRLRFEAPVTVRELTCQGRGVGLLFRDTVQEDLVNGRLKILKLDGITLDGTNQIIYSTKRSLSPHAQAFLEFLRTWRPDKTPTRHRQEGPKRGLKSSPPHSPYRIDRSAH